MAHLWMKDEDRGWCVCALDVPDVAVLDWLPPPASLVRLNADGQERWVLLAPPSSAVWLNGVPVISGICVLRDRDQITVAGRDPVFFSNERLAAIERAPQLDRSLQCPRCRQSIAPASAAVCCPGCFVWHHQTDELGCWTYAERCALCSQLTRLDAGYRWTPEDL